MAIELRYIPVTHDQDLLLVHSAAMQLAEIGGIPIADQIRFAGMITAHCTPVNGSNHVRFSFHTDIDDKHYLLASVTEPNQTIRQEIPVPLTGDKLSTTLFPLPPSGEQLLQRLQDMEQFCLALSHELKASLAKLQLSLSLLEKEKLPAWITGYVGIIHRSADNMENTLMKLNQIIELGHRSPGVAKKINLKEVFDQVKEEYEEMLTAVHANVSADFDGVDSINYIDIYLRTILTNAISNAIKYADPSKPLRLTITTKRENAFVVLEIKDNGQGIDMKANGATLFLPFTRFSAKTQGAGIGLYLVKSMVERNGGKIEVESEKGKGAIFQFLLKEYDLLQNQN